MNAIELRQWQIEERKIRLIDVIDGITNKQSYELLNTDEQYIGCIDFLEISAKEDDADYWVDRLLAEAQSVFLASLNPGQVTHPNFGVKT